MTPNAGANVGALRANSTRFLGSAGEIAAQIADGALVAMPPDYSLPAMEVVRALIRRRARGLRLLGVPVLGFSADLLIGAGCVAEVETSAVSLGEAGLAPRFTEAAQKGEIKIRDATCPAIHTALQAAEKGVPFMPLRGVLGSDLVSGSQDWNVLQNRFVEGEEPIVYVQAAAPAKRGAWPLGVAEVYGIDDAHLARYARAAKTSEGFQRYLDEFVCTRKKNSLPA